MDEARRQAIERGYDAFTRGALGEVREGLADGFVYHPFPTSPNPEPIVGRDAVVEFLRPRLFERQWTYAREMVQAGDFVLVSIITGGETASGARVEQPAFHVWRYEGDVAVEGWLFADREEAERVAGLRA